MTKLSDLRTFDGTATSVIAVWRSDSIPVMLEVSIVRN